MFVSDNTLQDISKAYCVMQDIFTNILKALFPMKLEINSGWFTGHLHKVKGGQWQTEPYPIPVVRVPGVCDIEIDFDGIMVCTKLGRTQALNYSFEKFKTYTFEIYSMDEHLTDFYRSDQPLYVLHESITDSKVAEVAIVFSFPLDVVPKELLELSGLLWNEGFSY